MLESHCAVNNYLIYHYSICECVAGKGHIGSYIYIIININRASLVAQMVKNLPAMQDTWVQFLGREDPLQNEMATHSSILAWRIPWTEEPGGLQSMGSQRFGQN